MATVVVEDDGTFPTINAAIADAGTNNNDTIEVQGTWDNDDATQVVSSKTGIIIQADASSKHNGVAQAHANSDTTTYRHRVTAVANDHSFEISGTGWTVTDIDIQNLSTGTSDEVFRLAAGMAAFTAQDCLLGFVGINSQQDIVYYDSATNIIINLQNCICYNAGRAVVDVFSETNDPDVIINLNCCTTWDCGGSGAASSREGVVGHSSDTTVSIDVNLFNCIFKMATGTDVIVSMAVHSGTVSAYSIDHCKTNSSDWDTGSWDTATVDASSTLSLALGEATDGSDDIIINDETTSPYDLRLTDNANNDAQDAHTDADMDNEVGGQTLSIPAADILGTVRPQNTNHDIGAFEIVAAGGANPKGPLGMPLIGALGGPI